MLPGVINALTFEDVKMNFLARIRAFGCIKERLDRGPIRTLRRRSGGKCRGTADLQLGARDAWNATLESPP